MLPDSDGLDICKGIRNDRELAQTPVIFLTARASETDRIVGLELGANDYIVKPFFIRELIARIRLQFRPQAPPARALKAGGVELDRSSCQVRLHGELLSLTATEFRLLEYLMSCPGNVFSQGTAAERCVGAGSGHYGPHGGCLHSAPAAESGTRSCSARTDPLRARLRLLI